MGSPLAPGAAPIAGYRLLSPLGRGGFGEVWRTEAPGGFVIALKFVRLDGIKDQPELRALELLRNIRHPHLLDIQFAVHAEGWLMIAMPLCDQSLADRLRICREQHLPGIPFEELLRYLDDAAKGIDFLNEPRHQIREGPPASVQHRDIKPQNLLLVGGSVRVADFGLAKILSGPSASASGGMTAAYAPPELFQNRVATTTDQYSLAVTYLHLRTGRLPFTGNHFAVMYGHLQQEPPLTGLTDAEKPVVARALAKDADKRWPSCQEFVRRLVESANGGAPVPTTLPYPPKPDPEPPPPTLSQSQRPEPPAVEVPVADLPLIDTPDNARREQQRWAKRLGNEATWTNSLGVRFRLIPPGKFAMGASRGDTRAQANEQPRRVVAVTQPFWLAEFPLTNTVVREFLGTAAPGDTPHIEKLLKDRSFAARCRRGDVTDDVPVVEISAHDAEILCFWLGRRDGRSYRLPTEAEWEYAARAGACGPYWWEDGSPATHYAVFSGKGPTQADGKRGNTWGLIDTLGNVAEWTGSVYDSLASASVSTSAGGLSGYARTVRGGSWRDHSLEQLRVSRRQSMAAAARVNFLGVRLVCEQDEER